MEQYRIPCQHETDWVSTDVTVSDYYSLSEAEVLELLLAAQRWMTHEDGNVLTQQVASIQCRLGQGIVGQVCPHEIDGKVARRQNQIYRTYIHYVQHPEEYVDEIGQLAKELHQLMQFYDKKH